MGGGDTLRGAVGVLLCDRGPKPRLTDDEYRAAVALHTGYGGESVGGECELCGKNERHGHHRWCQGLQAEPGLEHDRVRDEIVKWMAEAAPVYARRERMLGPGVRADVEVSAPAGGLVELEIKTVDMRCEVHEGKTLAKVASKLTEEVGKHYGSREVKVLVLDAAGNMTRASRATVAKLSAMGTTEGAERVPLMAVIGKACAAAEAASAGVYEAERDAWVAARRLVEQRGNPEARREATRVASAGDGTEPDAGSSSTSTGLGQAAGTRSGAELERAAEMWSGAAESTKERRSGMERGVAEESKTETGGAERMGDADWRDEVEARIAAAGAAVGCAPSRDLRADGRTHRGRVEGEEPAVGPASGAEACLEHGTATQGAFAPGCACAPTVW